MRPKRFQYRPLSKPITFLHSAWWEVGPIEFSVWHTPNAKPPNDDRFTFRVRVFGWFVIDLKFIR